MTFTPPRHRGVLPHSLPASTAILFRPAEIDGLLRCPTVRSTPVEHPPERRYERSTKRVLDQRRRDEGRDAHQPGLFNAELYAKGQLAKSGGENDDVPKRHRDEQQRH